MKVFVDTFYWIAIANPRDSWKIPAQQARARLTNAALVTTDEVLSEFLTALAGGGVHLRRQAAAIARAILADENITVISQNHSSFLAALSLYEDRADKGYSLTDCVSMNVMKAEGITEILTNDHHFEQEGFMVLIRR